MAVMKKANASVVEPTLDLVHWNELHAHRTRHGAAKVAATVPDPSRYLLTHVTILASVQTEQGEDWLIKPECSHLVNNNQDAFENEVIRLSYRTFMGAFNFVEHYQNSKASKGTIVDSVARKIGLTDDCWVYYVDLLVATDHKFVQLVQDILDKKINYLSMGCLTDLITCSFCGKSNDGVGVVCGHLANSKGKFLSDRDGVPRRVAELCGHKRLPGGGVKFVEASWVATPAFPGACVGRMVSADWELPSDFRKSASGLYLPGKAKVASLGLSNSVNGHLPTASSAELSRLATPYL